MPHDDDAAPLGAGQLLEKPRQVLTGERGVRLGPDAENPRGDVGRLTGSQGLGGPEGEVGALLGGNEPKR